MKKGLLIAAIVLIALALIVFACAFVVSGFNISNFGGVKYMENTYKVEKGFEKIEINTNEDDVILKLSEDGKASVVCEEPEKVKHTVEVEGNTLKIDIVDDRAWFEHWTIFSKKMSMTVYLPEKEYEELKIDFATGDVSVPDIFSFEDVSIKGSTGDVTFEADVEEKLQIKTSTGDIKAEGLKANEIEVSVSTGRVEAEKIDCKEKISVKVSTGRLILKDVNCGELYTDGSTGSVELKDVVASGLFEIERGTGSVHFDNCDAKDIKVKTSTGSVSGTLRTPKIFTTKVATGSVHVPESTTGGKCEITTATGSVNIQLSGK